MNLSLSKLSFVIALLAILMSASCKDDVSDTLTIAVAANMQFAMPELIAAFTSETGVACQLIVGSSGKLTAQILQGAPYDVLLSADMKYPQEIYDQGLGLAPPEVYSRGQLVLWSMRDGVLPSIAVLDDLSISKIALANPKTAPYGRAAMDVIGHHNLGEELAPKLVYGESISQVNQFVSTQAVDIGFTALSVVVSARMQGKGQWVVMDQATYQPIEQGAIVIKRNKDDNRKGTMFLEFLQRDTARSILKKSGYSTHTTAVKPH